MAAATNGSYKDEGQIQVIFGPMFSGKTTELIRRVRRYRVAEYKCFLIKYAKENRYAVNSVSTHNKEMLPAVPAVKLGELEDEAMNAEVIGIDEGQFYPDVVDFCSRLANKGKIVIVAALDGTFQQKAFGDILNLVPIAESVEKLNAICMQCFQSASFTKRICEGTEIEIMGGADEYLAVCRRCFLTSNKKVSSRKPPCNSSTSHDVNGSSAAVKLTFCSGTSTE